MGDTREPSCYARRRSPSCIAQPYKAKALRFTTFSLVRSETSNMRGHAASEVPAISKQPPSEFQELSTVSSRIVLPHLMSSLVGPVTVTRFFSIAGNIRMIFPLWEPSAAPSIMGLSGMTLCDFIGTPQNGALHRGTLRQCALNHNTLGNGFPGMASPLVGLRPERGGWSIGDGPSERIRPRWCTQERHSETVDPGETRRQGRLSGMDDSGGTLSRMVSPAWHPPSWG